MRRLTVALSLPLMVAPSACSSGEGDSVSNTFGTRGPEDETETGDGDPGDGDGDGAPGDGDGAPGDGDGAPGDGDGDGDGAPGDGDGDGDGLCQRNLYMRDGDGSWEVTPLDIAWTGPNAPPCEVEPMAATYLELWDQLLIWGADGQFYRRIGVTWQPPEPIANRWAVLASFELDSVYNVPPINGATSYTVTFSALPSAFLFEVFQDGATSYTMSVPLMDEAPPGPPQSASIKLWSTTQADGALLGLDLNWWGSWQGFDNGMIYQANGALEWSAWPIGQAPLFQGAPGSLDPAQLEAAWGEYELDRLYFVGP